MVSYSVASHIRQLISTTVVFRQRAFSATVLMKTDLNQHRSSVCIDLEFYAVCTGGSYK